MNTLLALLPLLLILPVSIPDISVIAAAADSLYVLGEFDAAALEYKRALFLASYEEPSDSDTLLPQIKLAMSLYRNGEQKEADAILYSLEGPTVRMVRAVLLIEEGNPYLAALAIDSTTREVFGTLAYRLRGWAYFEAGDFWNAARQFGAAGEDSLGTLVGELSDVKLKNPVTARWLSLIPGLGETYAGRPLFGLWAFLVNAGDTYLIVNAILQKQYLDAILVYTFLWQRFYAGSMANADRFAKEYNERKIAAVLNPIRDDFGEREVLRLDLEALNELYRISGRLGSPVE